MLLKFAFHAGKHAIVNLQILLDHIKTKENDEALTMLQKLDSDHLKGEIGTDLLHFASAYSNEVIIQYLIDAGVNVDVLNTYINEVKVPPLTTAILHSADRKTLETLLDAKANIYRQDEVFGCSILELVVFTCHNWGYKSLFLERVKSDCFNNSAVTAEKLLLFDIKFYHAALLRDKEILSIMLSRGCSVSDSDHCSGKTALHIAVFFKDWDTIKFLLRNGADINVTEENGLTPLALAGEYGESAEEYEILNYLLDQGSSLNLLLDNVVELKEFILRQGKRAIVRTIISRPDIDFNAKDASGRTSLHFIARNKELRNDQSIIEDLQQRRIDFNVLDIHNESPLLSAAVMKNSTMVLFLLENGVDVNVQNTLDVSALYQATWCPSYLTKNNSKKKNIYNLVELLLQYGADPQLATVDNFTVIDNIVRQQSYDLAKPILAYLVLHKDRGGVITELIRTKIDSNQTLKQEFELCQKDLAEIKGTTFNQSLTGFNLMFDSEKKIKLYARNEEVFTLLTNYYSTFTSNSYFFDLLKRRLEKVFLEIKTRRKVSDFLCQILASDYYTIPNVIDKIIDYLNDQDLQNIIQV